MAGNRTAACALLICVSLTAAAPTSWPAAAILYSSVGEDDCAAVPRLEIGGGVLESAQGLALFKCAGPPGHALYVVDNGTRSWFALERQGHLHSFEQDIVYDFRLGNFPNVSSGIVEWRAVDSKIIGLIFRVHYQRQTDKGVEPASVLYVYNLQGEAPVLLGNAASNSEARDLLDRSLR